MIKLMRPTPFTAYPDDVARMVRVLAERGFEASMIDVEAAWSAHSDDYCATWLFLPTSDDELADTLRNYLVTVGTLPRLGLDPCP